MTQVDKQKMMTNDPIPKLILKLSVPTVISMLITSFYSLVDTYFVGQINTSATAAVGVVFPLMNIIQAFGFFFGHGSGNAVSRRLGAEKPEAASEIASCGLFCSVICGLIITILGLIFLDPLAMLLGSTDTILPYTIKYLRIILLGAPIMAASFVINNQIRFQGNAMFSMLGVLSGSIINLILDPILILFLDMGVVGAAIATVVGQASGLIVLLIGYRLAGCVPLKIKHLKSLRVHFLEIAGGGLPSLFRQGLASVATIALNQMAGPFGDPAIAAMSIVSRIMFFGAAVVIGCGQGFQPVCGFNYGAGNTKRVKEAYWFTVKATTILMLIFAVVGFIFSNELVALFREDDLLVHEIGGYALRLQCITLILTPWATLTNMLFQTCKWTVPATVVASARQGLFFIPVILIFPPCFGLLGLQLAQPISDILSFTLAVILYRKLIHKLDS